ncbi:MAG: class I SAM-dependent methyltransferase [archaeon]|nr:class I SAM-dependent methyltransferase [archaeon]
MANWKNKVVKMTQGTKKRIKNDFNNLARHYQQINKGETNLPIIFSNLPKSRKKALEIGCGIGRLSKKLANKFKEVYAIDISPKMIAEANRRISKVHFIEMDAEHLRFKNNSFDFIISRNTFHHVNLKKAITESKRVLKKEGILVIIDIVIKLRKPIIPLCYLIRIQRFFKNLITKGITKAKKQWNFDIMFLRHLKHDRFMNKKEFYQQYSSLLPGSKMGNIDKKFGYVIWKNKTIIL